jgi:hypothetical protein
MSKKLTLPLAALAVVLALIVPATAAAEDVLLPVGTLIRVSTPKGLTIASTKTGNITCTEATWEGTLNENGGKLLIKKMEGFAKGCKTAGGTEVVMNSTFIEPTEIKEGEVEKGTLTWKFTATIGSLTCKYEGVGAGFTYTKGGDKSAFKEASLSVTPAACGTTAKVLAAESTDQYFSTEKKWEPVKWL